ncbi:MAG: hypothetical protein ACOCXQ_04620 [Patescibacteria group bacterium]
MTEGEGYKPDKKEENAGKPDKAARDGQVNDHVIQVPLDGSGPSDDYYVPVTGRIEGALSGTGEEIVIKPMVLGPATHPGFTPAGQEEQFRDIRRRQTERDNADEQSRSDSSDVRGGSGGSFEVGLAEPERRPFSGRLVDTSQLHAFDSLHTFKDENTELMIEHGGVVIEMGRLSPIGVKLPEINDHSFDTIQDYIARDTSREKQRSKELLNQIRNLVVHAVVLKSMINIVTDDITFLSIRASEAGAQEPHETAVSIQDLGNSTTTFEVTEHRENDRRTMIFTGVYTDPNQELPRITVTSTIAYNRSQLPQLMQQIKEAEGQQGPTVYNECADSIEQVIDSSIEVKLG